MPYSMLGRGLKLIWKNYFTTILASVDFSLAACTIVARFGVEETKLVE